MESVCTGNGTVGSNPTLSAINSKMQLLLYLLLALGLNSLMFIPAYLHRTDKLTDLSYALTFALLVLTAFSLSRAGTYGLVLLFMILAWALRLGGFLYLRIRAGKVDRRFNEIRTDFRRFAFFWLAQGFTAWLLLLPVFLFFVKPISRMSPAVWPGLLLWLTGLLLEATADQQKSRFRSHPANRDRWIDSGLWRLSRHPNYLGEILVWTGVYLFVLPALDALGAGLGLISPVAILLLLRFGSGVPILEKAAESRWGHFPEYRAYQGGTGLLLPSGKQGLWLNALIVLLISSSLLLNLLDIL